MRVAKEYNDFCMVVGEPAIGPRTWIGAFTVIDGSGGLVIGAGCDISCGVHIYTHDTVHRCHTGTAYHADGSKNRDAIEKSPVSIGDHVFIGANSVILRGVTIGSNAVIGAGSVIKAGTVIGPGELWAGNPARFIRMYEPSGATKPPRTRSRP